MSPFRNLWIIGAVFAVHMVLIGGYPWSKHPLREKVGHPIRPIVSYGFIRSVDKLDTLPTASLPDAPKPAHYSGSRVAQLLLPDGSFTTFEHLPAQTAPPHDLAVAKGTYVTTDFFVSDAVDEVAQPDENFDALLQQVFLLPPSSFAVVFWININGETIDVEWLESSSLQLPTDSLLRLLAAKFRPAQKNGLPVPSIKIIQIENPLSFSL